MRMSGNLLVASLKRDRGAREGSLVGLRNGGAARQCWQRYAKKRPGIIPAVLHPREESYFFNVRIHFTRPSICSFVSLPS
jgi:hypothetical protein